MAFWNNAGNSARRARTEMEEAAMHGQNEVDFQEKLRVRTGDEKFARTYRVRGRLYDKIPFSLHTMDIIIYAIVGLIVVALIVGIAMGN